jgi:hypothetical protein
MFPSDGIAAQPDLARRMLNAQLTSSIVTRDLRIDFFRGLALYMILVDHVVGDPIGKLTFRSVGFSDAAELFVFLSGISCAIVYSGVLAADYLKRSRDGHRTT